MKLKTLKDIESIDEDCIANGGILKEEIKQEAIKWVNKGCSCSACHQFKKFFNITEEDLK